MRRGRSCSGRSGWPGSGSRRRRSRSGSEPTPREVQIALLVWISVPYVLAGLVAWWRRPDSRLGVLMIAGGFAIGFSGAPVRGERGAAHARLGVRHPARPRSSCTSTSRSRTASSARASSARSSRRRTRSAIGLQIVKLMVSPVRDPAPGDVAAAARAAHRAGAAALARRDVPRRDRRPRHQAAAGGPAAPPLARAPDRLVRGRPRDDRRAVRRRRLPGARVGVPADPARDARRDRDLAGRVPARAARRAARPLGGRRPRDRAAQRPAAGRAARRARPRAARPVARRSPTGCPSSRATPTSTAAPVEVPGRRRARGDADRAQRRAGRGAAPRPGARTTSRSCSTRSAPPPGSRSRTRACRPSSPPASRRCRARAPARSRPARRSASASSGTSTTARSSGSSRCRSQLSLLERQLSGRRPGGGERLVDRRSASSRSRSRSCATSRAASTRRCSPATGSASRSSRSRRARPVPVALDVDARATRLPGAGRGRRLLRRHREPREHGEARAGDERDASTSRAAAASVVVEVVDDGVGGADPEGGSGLRGLADRVEALGGRLRVWTPAGGGTRVRAEIPCE